MRIIAAVGIAAVLCAADPPRERVDKIFAAWDKTNSPGCALAVIRDGGIVYQRGYGMADLDHDLAITPASVFHVASVSKQFTAAAIVLLAQQGKLLLDDPVRKYIPELADFGKPLTIRHLIHHTSGLRDQWNLLILSGWRLSEDVVRDEDVMSLVGRMRELNFPPGEMHLYSNTGYTVLAQIVKRVSGKSLRAFTEQEIFGPLGMRRSHFRDDHLEVVKNMAYGYQPMAGGGWRMSIPNYDTVGASSLLTTVGDMALWDENFYTGKVGGRRMTEQMMEAFTLNNGKPIDYRFGQVDGRYRGVRTVEHSGADAGYRAHYMRFPGERFSVVCLCNATINPSALARETADVFLEGKLAPKAGPEKTEPVTPAEADMNKFTGLYWHPGDEEILRVVIENGRLGRRLTDFAAFTALGPNRFRGEGGLECTFTEHGVELSGPGREPDVYQRVEPWAPPSPAEFAGTYYSEEIDSTYRIALREGKLELNRKKVRTHEMQPTMRDAFYAPQLGYLRFDRDASGRITGFRLTSGRVRNLRFIVGQASRPAAGVERAKLSKLAAGELTAPIR